MENNLNKWTKKWTEHIINTSKLYFEEKEINYLGSYIYYKYTSNNNGEIEEIIDNITLNFEHNGKYYDHQINYKSGIFLIHCWYRNYEINKEINKMDEHSILGISTNNLRFDDFGLYFYSFIGGQSSFNETPFSIIKFIEDIILNHKIDNDGFDNGGGEEDPIEPIVPTEVTEPELSIF